MDVATKNMLTNHRRKGVLWVFISAYNRLMPQAKKSGQRRRRCVILEAVNGKNQNRKCGTLSVEPEMRHWRWYMSIGKNVVCEKCRRKMSFPLWNSDMSCEWVWPWSRPCSKNNSYVHWVGQHNNLCPTLTQINWKLLAIKTTGVAGEISKRSYSVNIWLLGPARLISRAAAITAA